MLEKHGEEVLVIDLRPVSGIADYFVLATAQTNRQVSAMADHLEQELRAAGRRPRNIEGLSRRVSDVEALTWVLVDCGDVVVHLFNPPARNFYQLERLWADAPRVPVNASAA